MKEDITHDSGLLKEL